MAQEGRSWLPVGLALSATVILASFVTATCAWRAPTTRRTAARAPTASIADPQPELAVRDGWLATTAVGVPAALDVPTTQAKTQAAPAESEPGAQREEALAHGRTLDVPWALPGQCAAREDGWAEARAAYLATFVPVPAWHTTLFVHPNVAEEGATRVARDLQWIHDRATTEIGLPSEPPPVYLYPSVERLRAHSCLGASAVAYYDGAIHLAPDAAAYGELSKSLHHEYAHHVLVSNGVGKPIWFQEGTAMTFANEVVPYGHQIRREHSVELPAMVDSFPLVSLEAAAVFNVQAREMTDFLAGMCMWRSNCNPAELAGALLNGSATPETLFAWATAERGSDLIETTPLQFWHDYEARGYHSRESIKRMLHRQH